MVINGEYPSKMVLAQAGTPMSGNKLPVYNSGLIFR